MFKKIKNSKKGVFGLTAVQSFFAILLAIALLAYVIVVLMGTLSTTAGTILPLTSYTTTDTGALVNDTGYTLSQSTLPAFASPAITTLKNATVTFTSGNYSLTSNVVKNLTDSTAWGAVSITYTYKADSVSVTNANSILGNTSTGITGFFSSISPVYAILAVLVIILVLVVLVRVVQAPSGRESSPSL